jgi:hypothetical protein
MQFAKPPDEEIAVCCYDASEAAFDARISRPMAFEKKRLADKERVAA